MDPRAALHPTDEALTAFGLGKLPAAEADTVATHVEACETCRDRAAGLSGDGFLDRLKAAQSRDGTPAPDGSLTGVARNVRPAAELAGTIPAELADHPQYEDVRELGKGGMGVVYRARNRLMGRTEVLKVANRALLAARGATERFLQEIRSAARLRHPNVVAAYAALEIDQLLVFAMEYVAGEDLDKVVRARGPLPAASACYYAYQVALGLRHADEKGMVHRDIKPGNLILARDGRKAVVKILDFGLAKVTSEKGDGGLTGDGKMLGTPHYIAPEQVRDATRADIRADIYSLGCTLYFLLTGEPPFSGGSVYAVLHAHQSTDARPVHRVRLDVAPEVSGVVAKMMAKAPDDRYQTPGEVANALVPFFKPDRSPPAPGLSQSGAVAIGPSLAGPGPGRTGPPVRPAPTPVAEGPTRAEAAPVPERPGRKPWAVWAGIAGALCTGLALWAAGAFQVKTKDGTIVLENLPDDADVFVDGERVTVTWGDGKTAEIRARPGTRKVEVKRDGVTVRGEEVEIEDGKRRILTAKLSPAAAPPPPAEKEAVPPAGKEKEPPAGKGKEAPAENDGYVPLFNGKDLTGLEKSGNSNVQWQVERGVLVGRWNGKSGYGGANLGVPQREYQNFRFRVETTLCEEWSSSMVFLWRRGGEKNIGWWRANIGTTAGRDVAETGVLQGTVKKSPNPPLRFRTDEWFTQEVVVIGKRIRVYVNNVLTTEHELAELPKPGGVGIALSGNSTMRIRRMEIKELPPTKPADPK